jgi:hypothetical protein
MGQILLVAIRHTSRWTNSTGVDQWINQQADVLLTVRFIVLVDAQIGVDDLGHLTHLGGRPFADHLAIT